MHEGALRLGVLGCGRVFERFHLPALRRSGSVALVAAADPDPARLAWAADPAAGTRRCASADELLDLALDAVLVLTPPASHAELCMRAADAGRHVLVEKPMALTAPDGVRMAEAARRAGRVLQIGFARRFRPPYEQLRAALADLAGAGPGIRDAECELSFSTAGWQAHSGFLGDAGLGGGVIDDVLSHQVDLVEWLLGPVTAVRATAAPGADGAVSAELRVARATVRCRAAHGPYTERLAVGLEDGRVLEATGSRMEAGRVPRGEWRRRRAQLLDRAALLGDRLLGRPNASRVSFERQLADFVDRVRGGSGRGTTADEGVRGLRVVDACRASLRQHGAWVGVD